MKKAEWRQNGQKDKNDRIAECGMKQDWNGISPVWMIEVSFQSDWSINSGRKKEGCCRGNLILIQWILNLRHLLSWN